MKYRRCIYRRYRDIGSTGDIRNSSKLKNIDNKYIKAPAVGMTERFAHFSQMHEGSTVSATKLLSHA